MKILISNSHSTITWVVIDGYDHKTLKVEVYGKCLNVVSHTIQAFPTHVLHLEIDIFRPSVCCLIS